MSDKNKADAGKVVKLSMTEDELNDEIDMLLGDSDLVRYHRMVRKHNKLTTLLEAREQLRK